MDNNGLRSTKPVWWLAGGCVVAILCLVAAGTGAALGWTVLGNGTAGSGVDVAPTTDAPGRLRGNPVGQRAPAFTLQDVDGSPRSLEEVRGRPILINFWATWCGPCRTEMPVIEEAYQSHRDDGLVVWAVDVEENPELARTFAGWLGISFTILDDGTGDVAYRYGVRSLPSTFFVDRDGVIRAWQVGAMNRSVLDRHLSKVLE